MRKLKLYIAASLDGYIAGTNGEIDWLDVDGDEDYGYQEFCASIDTTLMGNSTYQLTLTVDKLPDSNMTNYVFTKDSPPPDTDYVNSVTGDIGGFVRTLKQQAGKDVWLVGYGQINTVMLKEGLIDEIILTASPLVRGEGISRFCTGRHAPQFQNRELPSLQYGSCSVAPGEKIGI